MEAIRAANAASGLQRFNRRNFVSNFEDNLYKKSEKKISAPSNALLNLYKSKHFLIFNNFLFNFRHYWKYEERG